MSSSSSSSSSTSSSNGNDNAGNGSGGNYGYHEGPSRSRPRAINEVWPDHFLEDLATRVAIDASRFGGRLAAAQALVNVFQVCSTWRAISRSDHLWDVLTRRIWGCTHLLHDTWRDEYIYRHRTARNFWNRQYSHFTLLFDPADVDDPNTPAALMCRCLALSDRHLACGFYDGAVRLFDLTTRLHTRTFRPQHRNGLGRFSRAVSGIVITDQRLVFATLNGDIHVAIIDDNAHPRRAHQGNEVNDGPLVDFTGCGQWWVGLYAGVPGQAFHIWDGNSEELTWVGGSLTDPEALMGWHLLTDLTEVLGRVRVTNQESAVACTSSRWTVLDLRNPDFILDREHRRGCIVSSFDACNEVYIIVDSRGVASVRRGANNPEEVCRFNVRSQGVVGCINGGYALMCAGGVLRVWEIEQRGAPLYSLGERIGEVNALVADDRHVAAVSSDTTIHLWDFGAQQD